MNKMNEFQEMAKEAGFTDKQIEFLNDFVAKYPHSHSVEEIDGLEEMLEEIDDNGEDERDGDEG